MDEIQSEFLKVVNVVLLSRWSCLFSTPWRSGHCHWMLGPLFKKGDQSVCSNFSRSCSKPPWEGLCQGVVEESLSVSQTLDSGGRIWFSS